LVDKPAARGAGYMDWWLEGGMWSAACLLGRILAVHATHLIVLLRGAVWAGAGGEQPSFTGFTILRRDSHEIDILDASRKNVPRSLYFMIFRKVVRVKFPELCTILPELKGEKVLFCRRKNLYYNHGWALFNQNLTALNVNH
jgi:hypothetical protein